jgi:hypothetical protein
MPIPSGYTSGQVVQAVPTGINSALVLIKTQTIDSAVSTVEVTDAFSATYDNYNGVLRFILTGSTTAYYATRLGIVYSGAASSFGSDNNAASVTSAGVSQTSGLYAAITVANPFIAKPSYGTFSYQGSDGSNGVLGFWNHRVSTSFTGFTITPSTGTLTGGTIRVYGYTNS